MLSKRLEKIIDLVEDQATIADIGTDHGLIPAELLKRKKVPKVIMTDLREKPLKRAQNYFKDKAIFGEYDFRLGNGLSTVSENEVDQVIIAGMGGEEIVRILDDDLVKSYSFNSFILQPMTKVSELRSFLQEKHFKIDKELMVKDKNEKLRFFPIIVASKGHMNNLTEMELEFGTKDKLVINQDYLDFLNYELRRYQEMISKMADSDNIKTKSRRLDFERRFKFLKEYNESLQNNQTD